MLQVNINLLVSAVHKADPFVLPEMNEGTNYLYHSIYEPLSMGEDVRLSGLDFDAFDSEDINTFHALYGDVLEAKGYQSGNIMKALRKITPACKTAAYV